MQTQFNIQHGLLAICSLVARLHSLLFSLRQLWLRLSSGNDNYFLLAIPNNILPVILLDNSWCLRSSLVALAELLCFYQFNSPCNRCSSFANYCSSLNNPSNEVSLSSSGSSVTSLIPFSASLTSWNFFLPKGFVIPSLGRFLIPLMNIVSAPVNLPECVLISVTFLAKISMTFTKCHGHFWRNKIILILVINTGIFKNFESKISGILFHQKFWQKSSRHYGS